MLIDGKELYIHLDLYLNLFRIRN